MFVNSYQSTTSYKALLYDIEYYSLALQAFLFLFVNFIFYNLFCFVFCVASVQFSYYL